MVEKNSHVLEFDEIHPAVSSEELQTSAESLMEHDEEVQSSRPEKGVTTNWKITNIRFFSYAFLGCFIW